MLTYTIFMYLKLSIYDKNNNSNKVYSNLKYIILFLIGKELIMKKCYLIIFIINLLIIFEYCRSINIYEQLKINNIKNYIIRVKNSKNIKKYKNILLRGEIYAEKISTRFFMF